jgi:hypothetical protein
VVTFTPLPLYTRGKSTDTRFIGDWAGPRVGLDAVEKGKIYCRELKPGRPAGSSSLYRLSYPKPWMISLVYVFWWSVCLDYELYMAPGLLAWYGSPSCTPWMKPQPRDRVPLWNSFSIAETPDDGRLGPKHVVKRYK